MSFRNLHIFNIAMLRKLELRILNKLGSLLSHTLKARYFPNCEFFDAPLGSSPSYTLAWDSHS